MRFAQKILFIGITGLAGAFFFFNQARNAQAGDSPEQNFKNWAGVYEWSYVTFDDPYEYTGFKVIHRLTLDSSGRFTFYNNYGFDGDEMLSLQPHSVFEAGKFEIVNDSTIRLRYFKNRKSALREERKQSSDSIIDVQVIYFDKDDTLHPLSGRLFKTQYSYGKRTVNAKMKNIEVADSSAILTFKIPAGNNFTWFYASANGYAPAYYSLFAKNHAYDYTVKVFLAKDPYNYPGYEGEYGREETYTRSALEAARFVKDKK
jgi:hypothetical protein